MKCTGLNPVIYNRISACNSCAVIENSPLFFLSTLNHKVRVKLQPVSISNEYVLHILLACLLSNSLCYLEAKDKCSGITFKTITQPFCHEEQELRTKLTLCNPYFCGLAKF